MTEQGTGRPLPRILVIAGHGKEIIDEPTQFKAGRDAPAVELVLSNRGAVVTGRVADEGGNPVGRATVLLFRGGGAAAGGMPIMVRTSAAGEFRIGPARGGDYLLVALPASARPIQPGERDRLARLAIVAERITLGELDERTIDLRVVAEK